MFLPFVHQLGRHLSGFKEQPAWLTIGQVLDTQGGLAAIYGIVGLVVWLEAPRASRAADEPDEQA